MIAHIIRTREQLLATSDLQSLCLSLQCIVFQSLLRCSKRQNFLPRSRESNPVQMVGKHVNCFDFEFFDILPPSKSRFTPAHRLPDLIALLCIADCPVMISCLDWSGYHGSELYLKRNPMMLLQQGSYVCFASHTFVCSDGTTRMPNEFSGQIRPRAVYNVIGATTCVNGVSRDGYRLTVSARQFLHPIST
jgi:hypothetical protein